MVARSLGIPSSYAFDYEFARTQHGLGCRAARRVVVPEAIPQDRLDRLGASERKVRRYPGLKEEYYLHGFVPRPSRPGRARPRSQPDPRRRAYTSGGVALPPPREPAVRGGARAAGNRPGGAGSRPPSDGRTARRDPSARPPFARRPRARDRRAEPRRAGRPRRLGRRHDEPRGGRARRSRLHDVCRTTGRGRQRSS